MAKIDYKVLTSEHWDDFEKLFGEKGADGGCWCMFFRVTGKEFARKRYEGNKQDMKLLVEQGRKPGILAFVNNEPAGWISIAPREEFHRINRSPVLRKIDDEPVWSIVCFFIDPKFRKNKLSESLLEYAISYAKSNGVKILEGYPRDLQDSSDENMYVGVVSTFEKMGFREVARRSSKRPIMRLKIA